MLPQIDMGSSPEIVVDKSETSLDLPLRLKEMNKKWFSGLPESMNEILERMKKEPELMYGRCEIQVVVAGEPGTGKSSLIHNAYAHTGYYREYYHGFDVDSDDDDGDDDDGDDDDLAIDGVLEANKFSVVPLLEPKKLPLDFHPRALPVPVIAVDTSSGGLEDEENVKKLKQADVIVLTFGCDNLDTLEKLRTHWLPGLDRLEVDAFVVVAACKADLKDKDIDLYRECEFMDLFSCVSVWNVMELVECSNLSFLGVHDVFYRAQVLLLEPIYQIFRPGSLTSPFAPELWGALMRIFFLLDSDKVGIVKLKDFNDFQVKCFGPKICKDIQKRLRYRPQFDEKGITFERFTRFFLYICAYYDYQDYNTHSVWTVLRQFGYNTNLELSDVLFPSSILQIHDGGVELSSEAIEFLSWIFNRFDVDNVRLDGALTRNQLIKLFDTAPKSPFSDPPYKGAAEKYGLSLDGFLSLWALMTLLDPTISMKNLFYIGYSGEPTSAISVTRERSMDCKVSVDCQLQQRERNVFQCFVFGPKKSGKSALLDSFLKRSHHDAYTPTSGYRYAVNVVGRSSWGTKQFLVLREFPEDIVDTFLSNGGTLAACDVAVFVYDSSDVFSRKGATSLLEKVDDHCKDTDFKVPFRYIAANTRTGSFVLQQDTKLPIKIQLHDIFCEIAIAGGCPSRSVLAWKYVSCSFKAESSEGSMVGLQGVL